jgi:integrase
MIESGEHTGQLTLHTLTLKRLLDNHIDHLERVSNRGRRIMSDYRTLLSLMEGDTTLADMDYDALAQFCRTRLHVDGVVPATVHQNILLLSGAITTGVLELGVPSSFRETFAAWRAGLTRAKYLQPPESRYRRVTPGEFDAIMNHVTHNWGFRIGYKDIVPFAIDSCMRLGEIVRLQVNDYLPNESTIIVRDRKHPVRKNDEVVPLMGEARAIIERRIAGGKTKDGFIFPYNGDSVSNGFRRITIRLEIDDLHFHDLRHEGISRLFEQGFQIQEVAMVSGHKDWKSLRRYVNLKASEVAAKGRK